MIFTDYERNRLLQKAKLLDANLGDLLQNPINITEELLIEEVEKVVSVRDEFNRKLSDYLGSLEEVTNSHVNSNPDLGNADG